MRFILSLPRCLLQIFFSFTSLFFPSLLFPFLVFLLPTNHMIFLENSLARSWPPPSAGPSWGHHRGKISVAGPHPISVRCPDPRPVPKSDLVPTDFPVGRIAAPKLLTNHCGGPQGGRRAWRSASLALSDAHRAHRATKHLNHSVLSFPSSECGAAFRRNRGLRGVCSNHRLRPERCLGPRRPAGAPPGGYYARPSSWGKKRSGWTRQSGTFFYIDHNFLLRSVVWLEMRSPVRGHGKSEDPERLIKPELVSRGEAR